MSLPTPFGSSVFEEMQPVPEDLLHPMMVIGKEKSEYEKLTIEPCSSIDTGTISFIESQFKLEEPYKIRLYELPYDRPWLPPKALELLSKLKKRTIKEKELIRLMEIVAERAAVYFQLPIGKFVAMTFHGRIVEISDSRISLLKKIQGQKYEEPIFVWRIGSKVFSGRI